MEFEYRFVKQNHLVLAILKGKLKKDSREALVKCTQELFQLESEAIILYFKEVTINEPVVYRELAILQAEIRKTKKLFLCGFTQAQKQVLLDKAIVRFNELRSELSDAIGDS